MILCLGAWSKASFVHSINKRKITVMGEVGDDTLDVEMGDGWDTINVYGVP